jgi:hypothetical protein
MSGTGVVADGIHFQNGVSILCWRVRPNSIGIFQSMDELIEVHGHGGRTCVHWIDDKAN